jgi:DNA polymerase
MSDNLTTSLLHDLRRLLRYHQAIGIKSYPSSPQLDGFLHPTMKNNARAVATASPRPVTLTEIRREMEQCRRCRLCSSRTNIVFGQGDDQAGLLIVAGWPSREDDRQGQPISGPAGDLLDKMLAAINLCRGKIFITQVVKCLPPDTQEPGIEEVNTCLPFLHRQIDALQPGLICAMGPLAANTLLKKNDSIFRLRGRLATYTTVRGAKIPVLPTLHPEFLLTNQAMKKASWQDLQMLEKRLKNRLKTEG